MKILKKGLFRVPLFCVLAGLASFSLLVHVFAPFVEAQNPDGSVTTDRVRVLIVYGFLLCATLVVGRRFFRKMKRREIAHSATFCVIILMTVLLSQWKSDGAWASPVISFYFSEITEWCRFVSQILSRWTGSRRVGMFAETLMPYVFVLFGKKSPPAPEDSEENLYQRTVKNEDAYL